MRRSMLLLSLTLVACVPDAYSPPPAGDPDKLFWSLTVNHPAVTLSTVAPYDTIQLVATPRTIKGLAISGLPPVTFTSLDLEHIQVSPTGLVHAIGITTQSPVVASLSVDNDQQVDTVFINVTDTATPPVLSRFTIHPAPGDSAKAAVGPSIQVSGMVPWRAFDPAGDSITGLSVYYATSDSTIATWDRTGGQLDPKRPGHLKVYATTTAYGITKTDSVLYTIGYPVLVSITITPQVQPGGKTIGVFVPDHLNVGPGAAVFFGNFSAPLTDVTFDNPANVGQNAFFCGEASFLCGTGNIPAFGRTPSDTTIASVDRLREFDIPGTYNFHSSAGAKGTIVVMTQ